MIRTTLIAAAVAIAQQFNPVMAHGVHNWIMDNPRTSWCCGPTDCHTVPRGTVAETAKGWRFIFDGVRYFVARDAANIFTSVDADFHICVNPDKSRRCFFRPVGAV